ncbi:MAG: hypothetical protein KDI30_11670, partial [Pseudomonadales bacterium]|nr:hypothetical protein [Pseudomonadales bacterium]
LSKDYIDTLLAHPEKLYPRSEDTNYKHPAKIIVAEPLSFQIEGYSKQWINNYRANLRRILDRYEEIDFLPEPFAVYQYYRYGLRLPNLQDKAKQVAFIVDFGGGTFDACVIESTNEGDVSISGKASKPLSADSVPIGGFFVNAEIAKYLIKRDLDGPGKKEADTYLKQYQRVLSGDQELSVLKSSCQIFIENLRRLERRCEEYKVKLVSQISDWTLTGDSYEKIFVEVPKNPFSNHETNETEFYSHQLRDIFIRCVWEAGLQKVVHQVLDRASEDLKGKRITITLISGGSANLRWLERLLMRDFNEYLDEAEPVPISHSFQEIVANGLAIECARRFYSEESEFVAVTYNPIKLHLQSDESELVTEYRYKSSADRVDMKDAHPGDIIPSAQALKHFFDDELQWKVKLKKPPKSYLNYYFCRAGDEQEVDRYNVEEFQLPTRDNRHFDSQVTISLIIHQDGTVRPKFIYKAENKQFGVEENSVSGRPFYIDMTADSQSTEKKNYYVGLDFGTSNSSVCLLTQDQIKLTRKRSSNDVWVGLANVLHQLPYPIAIAIKSFLGARDDDESARKGREAFEMVLALMAYIAASEAAAKQKLGKALKTYQHRSMGPLKALLATSLNALGAEAQFAKGFNQLFDHYSDQLDLAIDNFNDHKHDKLSAGSVNWVEHIEFIVRVFHAAFEGKVFGYCDTCNPDPFEINRYEGRFIVAHDQAPFINPLIFESNVGASSIVAFVADSNSGKALSLSPFLFWLDRDNNTLTHGCFMYDKSNDKQVLVKPCDQAIVSDVSSLNARIRPVFDKLFEDGQTMLGLVDLTFKVK